MNTGTSKTALGAARVALVAGVSATALIVSASQASADNCWTQGGFTGASVGGSLACGPNATATGANSTAVGGGVGVEGPTANAANSTAVGSSAYAGIDPNNANPGTGATALGSSSFATGNSSIAIGNQPTANTGAFGNGSIGIGTNVQAGSEVPFGGTNAIAIGTNASANNGGGPAGNGPGSLNNNAIAIGANTSAQGNNSVAIGAGAVSNLDNQIVLGSTSNQLITMNGATTFNGTNGGTTNVNGGFVNIVGGPNANTGNVSTLTSSNAAVNVSGGAIVNNGLIANNGFVANGGSTLNGPTQLNGSLSVAPGNNVDMGGNIIHNVGTPIFGTDAANKAYVDRGLNKAYEGTAIALAISQPVFGPGQNFAIRAGWGNYENENAFGVSAAGIIARDWFWGGSTLALDGGVGFGSNNAVAGKAGITLGFGPGYVAMK